MKRRDLLRSIPLGVLAAGIPFATKRRARAEGLIGSPMMRALLNAQQETDRVVVLIYLEGGNDGLNTLVPFEDPLYDKHRSTLGFVSPQEKASLTFRPRPDLGFNPMMNPLEPLWNEGKLAIVQNLGLENPNLSHFRGADIWNSASDTEIVEQTGWAARYLDHLYPDYPQTLPEDPLAITMGNYESLLFAGTRGNVDVSVPDPTTFGRAGEVVGKIIPNTEGGAELAYVRQLLAISNAYSLRFNSLFPQYAVSKVAYPQGNPLAFHLQHIAWCIAAGMKTRFYFASHMGYDTHFSQCSKDPTYEYGHARKLKELSEAIVSFQRDLEALGIADRVITMTYSEFGRRIAQNGPEASGTEHGTAAPHFLVGTHINGDVYGHNPDLENLDGNSDAHYEFDFRQLYASVLGDWFGVDETLRTSLLSPGSSHAPFATAFPVNGSVDRRHLIDSQARVVGQPAPAHREPSISPNPCRDRAVLTCICDAADLLRLRLYDVGGKQVCDLPSQSVLPGRNTLPINFPNLQSGSYYLQVTDSKHSTTVKLLIGK